MKVHPEITERLRAWMLAQPMFFVGTAPGGSDGHINISPKGLAGTFTVLDPLRVAYLDFTGSGSETIAHLRDNGRIVMMFCGFDGPPQIVRLHGRGRAVLPSEPEFSGLRSSFDRVDDHGVRAIIDIDVSRVSDSCGYSVPRMATVAERDLLDQWASHKTDEQLADYRVKKNSTSIDGLPALS